MSGLKWNTGKLYYSTVELGYQQFTFLLFEFVSHCWIDAITYLKGNRVDLIFLDINMDELSGIQLLESTKIESEVIITTAYGEYALKGFDLNVTDYLLKPFTFERFFQAVDKAQKNLSKKDVVKEKGFIFVKTEYRLEKLSLNDILYILNYDLLTYMLYILLVLFYMFICIFFVIISFSNS